MKKKPSTPNRENVELEPTVERRVVVGAVELREQDGTKSLSGYAAVFNEETIIGGGYYGFRERILPGAFKDTIVVDDVRALFNHDPNIVLGRRAGTEKDTLALREDDKGLRYDIDPPNTAQARDLVELVGRGDISQSSFAFIVPKGGDDWNYDEIQKGKLPLRTIKKVQLMDVSPVTYPAYPTTSVSARAKTMAAQGRSNSAGDSTQYFDSATSTLPESTRTAFVAAHRAVESAHAAVRALEEQIDISDSEDYGDTGSGTDDGDPGGDTSSNASSVTPTTRSVDGAPKLTSDAGHAVRALRRSLDGARHAAAVVRSCLRDKDLSDAGDDGAAAGGDEGSGDTGGANAATLDVAHRDLELALDELQEVDA